MEVNGKTGDRKVRRGKHQNRAHKEKRQRKQNIEG